MSDSLEIMRLAFRAGNPPEVAKQIAMAWRYIDKAHDERYRVSEWDTEVDKMEKAKDYLHSACEVWAELPRDEIERIEMGTPGFFPEDSVLRVTDIFYNILKKHIKANDYTAMWNDPRLLKAGAMYANAQMCLDKARQDDEWDTASIADTLHFCERTAWYLALAYPDQMPIYDRDYAKYKAMESSHVQEDDGGIAFDLVRKLHNIVPLPIIYFMESGNE